MGKHNVRGEEIPDQTPMEIPAGISRPPTMEEMIKRFVKRELSNRASSAGFESFEEANDFEVDDDDLDSQPSRHEIAAMLDDEMMVKRVKEKLDRQEKARQSRAAHKAQKRKDDENRSEQHGKRDSQSGSGELFGQTGAAAGKGGDSGSSKSAG